MVRGVLNRLQTHGKQCAGQGRLRIVVLDSALVESYLQHLRDGRSSLIADLVPSKVELFDGGIILSKIERKDTVRGGANWGQNASKV